MTNKEKLMQMIAELNDYDARLFLAFIERYLSGKDEFTGKLN